MRKIAILMFAFLCVHSLCFAQWWPVKKEAKAPSVAPVKAPVKALAAAPKEEAVEYKIFTGGVVSVFPGEAIAQITVKDEAETALTFIVIPGTGIYNTQMDDITLGDIKNGDNVRVKYIARIDGGLQAVSVRVLKK